MEEYKIIKNIPLFSRLLTCSCKICQIPLNLSCIEIEIMNTRNIFDLNKIREIITIKRKIVKRKLFRTYILCINTFIQLLQKSNEKRYSIFGKGYFEAKQHYELLQ